MRALRCESLSSYGEPSSKGGTQECTWQPCPASAVNLAETRLAGIHGTALRRNGVGRSPACCQGPGIQPAVICMAALMALSNVDHGPPPGFMKSIILVITTIVKRYIVLPRGLPSFQFPSCNCPTFRALPRPPAVGQFPS